MYSFFLFLSRKLIFIRQYQLDSNPQPGKAQETWQGSRSAPHSGHGSSNSSNSCQTGHSKFMQSQ
jgi:hypothetical protein